MLTGTHILAFRLTKEAEALEASADPRADEQAIRLRLALALGIRDEHDARLVMIALGWRDEVVARVLWGTPMPRLELDSMDEPMREPELE